MLTPKLFPPASASRHSACHSACHSAAPVEAHTALLASRRRTLVLLGVGTLDSAKEMALVVTSVALAPIRCCVGHRLNRRLYMAGNQRGGVLVHRHGAWAVPPALPARPAAGG
jgi:hypothetical protein